MEDNKARGKAQEKCDRKGSWSMSFKRENEVWVGKECVRVGREGYYETQFTLRLLADAANIALA
jgi:hypothetical protein